MPGAAKTCVAETARSPLAAPGTVNPECKQKYLQAVGLVHCVIACGAAAGGKLLAHDAGRRQHPEVPVGNAAVPDARGLAAERRGHFRQVVAVAGQRASRAASLQRGKSDSQYAVR